MRMCTHESPHKHSFIYACVHGLRHLKTYLLSFYLLHPTLIFQLIYSFFAPDKPATCCLFTEDTDPFSMETFHQ